MLEQASPEVLPQAPAGNAGTAREATGSLKIAAAVCFLDEEQHLPELLASLAAQTRPPDRLLLVDDGSTDGSARIAAEFAGAHPWARVLTRPPRPAQRDRLAAAAELDAFQWAVARCDLEWDVIAKLDADIRFNPATVATIERRMLADASLGVAGTFLAVEAGEGETVREPCPPGHVRGATKFYRRGCWDMLGPVPQILGWDTIDEIAARMHGWHTESFATDGGDSIHLRPTATRDGLMRGQRRTGACAWGYGAHPLHVVLGAVTRAARRPRLLGGLSYLAGWAGAAMHHAPRAAQPVRAYGRSEQLRRIRSALTGGAVR